MGSWLCVVLCSENKFTVWTAAREQPFHAQWRAFSSSCKRPPWPDVWPNASSGRTRPGIIRLGKQTAGRHHTSVDRSPHGSEQWGPNPDTHILYLLELVHHKCSFSSFQDWLKLARLSGASCSLGHDSRRACSQLLRIMSGREQAITRALLQSASIAGLAQDFTSATTSARANSTSCSNETKQRQATSNRSNANAKDNNNCNCYSKQHCLLFVDVVSSQVALPL